MLGHAVEGAAFFDEVGAVDADDLSGGETVADYFERGGVVFRLVVSRHEDGSIEHDEV